MLNEIPAEIPQPKKRRHRSRRRPRARSLFNGLPRNQPETRMDLPRIPQRRSRAEEPGSQNFQQGPSTNFPVIREPIGNNIPYISYRDTTLPVTVASKHTAYTPKVDLEIAGQGTVAYFVKPNVNEDSYYIINLMSKSNKMLLQLKIFDNEIELTERNGDAANFAGKKVKEFHFGLVNFDAHSRQLWVSIDKNHSVIKFGSGYMMELNTLFIFTALNGREKQVDAVIRELQRIRFENGQLANQSKYWALPVVFDPPCKILPFDEMTLEHLSRNTAMPCVALPIEAQRLFGHVAGYKIKLTSYDVDAINFSLDTEGCVLNQKLREKTANLFDNDKQRGYIRATIGMNRGEAPGVPYVLEIWPKHNHSPIHSHGDCVAVIKVLHGDLTASFYNSLPKNSEEAPQKIGEVSLSKGDVTWMTPELYQTHKLDNPSNISMAATIQCYAYLGSDTTHHETFDYILEGNRRLHYYHPRADFSFQDLLKTVHREYNEHRKIGAMLRRWNSFYIRE